MDSIKVPNEYVKHYSLKSLQSDKYLNNDNYLNILNGMIRSNTDELLSSNSLLMDSATPMLKKPKTFS